MAVERTLSIIKPDGVERGLIGEVFRRIEQAGFSVVACRMVRLSKGQAGAFYHVHRGKPFFEALTDYISSGPIVVSVLEGEGAIKRYRELMGATNPDNASPGTIRYDLAESLDRNTVHGSDAPDTAAFEIGFFFPAMGIFEYQRKPFKKPRG